MVKQVSSGSDSAVDEEFDEFVEQHDKESGL